MLKAHRDGYVLTDDPARLDHNLIHHWISTDTYWAAGRTRETMDQAIANSETAGIYRESDNRQVAFARIVTDRAVFAYLCDVYITPDLRGQGLGRWLVATLRDHLAAQGLNRLLLVTQTAQGVYAPLGFTPVDPDRWMICELAAHAP